MTPDRRVVVGVGNPWRRDDGVGHAVAAAARSLLPPGVAVACLDGEPARLLDAWHGAGLAVVIDGVRTGGTPGEVRRVDLRAATLPGPPALSSHGGGIADAVALGRALDRLPARLVLYAVEIGDDGAGPGLSAPVAAAVADTAAEVVAEVTGTSPPHPGP